MMTEQAMNYAKAAFDLDIAQNALEQASGLITENMELHEALYSPIISIDSKFSIIDRVFANQSGELRNLLKILCRNGDVQELPDVALYCLKLRDEAEGRIRARLLFTTEPDENQEKAILAMLKRKYGSADIQLEKKETPELIGGFVLKVGNQEYDYSLKRRRTLLRQKLLSE